MIHIDLNELEADEPKPLVHIHSDDNKNYEIQLVPNLGQHRFATGPRYLEDFLKIRPAENLGYHTSGVLGESSIQAIILYTSIIAFHSNFHNVIYCFILVLGVNRATKFALMLQNGAPIQTYHVTGKFGKATQDNFQGSRITNRSTYRHVTLGKLQALVASLQATYQRQMFDMSGLDIQSQAAYELACKGLIRPQNPKDMVIYGMRTTEFTGRTFTIEVQSMNAMEDQLANLVLNIAAQLRTVACCTQIRCTRYGHFSFEDSLLRSHWNLQNVLKSMHECEKIWKKYPSMCREDSATPVGYEDDVAKS